MGDNDGEEPQDGLPPERPQRDRPKGLLALLLGSPVIAAVVAGMLAWSPWSHASATPPSFVSVPSYSIAVPVTAPSASGSAASAPPSAPADLQASRYGYYSPSVYVNPTSGAGGTLVRISGTDFPPDAHVVILFSTWQMGDTTANAGGNFSNVAVTIPTSFSWSAPDQYYITAESGAFFGQTPFMLTG
jgi:hypothetical protein